MTTRTINPLVRTPDPTHPKVMQLAEEISPGRRLISIACAEALLPLGNCYWNAHVIAETHGGDVQHGWLFYIWPHRYVEAMHHAVWRGPDGVLIDVTEKFPNDRIKYRSTFLPDDSIEIDLQRAPGIESRHLLLSDSEDVRSWHRAYLAKHAAQKQQADAMYAAGYRWHMELQIAQGIKKPDSFRFTDKALHDSYQEACGILEQKGAALGAAIELLKKPIGLRRKPGRR